MDSQTRKMPFRLAGFIASPRAPHRATGSIIPESQGSKAVSSKFSKPEKDFGYSEFSVKNIHHRGKGFAEIGDFVYQELFTPRPPRLGGAIPAGSILVLKYNLIFPFALRVSTLLLLRLVYQFTAFDSRKWRTSRIRRRTEGVTFDPVASPEAHPEIQAHKNC